MAASTPDNLRVLFEDNHLIIINKRSGDIVQGDKTGDTPLSDHVKAYIKKKYHKPGDVFLGTAHRLDRPVSGIVVFAKTSKALERLNLLFKEKKIKKTYWAIVHNKPNKKSDTLRHYLTRDSLKNKSRAHTVEVANSKEAVLHYQTVGFGDNYSFLSVELETGRHHQIRVQLASMNCQIKGDLKYGAKRSNPDASICLHARFIEFVHPVQKEIIRIEAPVPEEKIWQDFSELKPVE